MATSPRDPHISVVAPIEERPEERFLGDLADLLGTTGGATSRRGQASRKSSVPRVAVPVSIE